MFTKNYTNMLKCLSCPGANSDKYSVTKPDGTTVYLIQSGTPMGAKYTSLQGIQYGSSSSIFYNGYPVIALGNNTTAESENDYSVGFISGFAMTTATAFTYVDGVYTETINFYLTNTTENEISFQEIGLYTVANRYSGSSSGNWDYLIYRKVFDAPVVVPSGNAITLTISFSSEV